MIFQEPVWLTLTPLLLLLFGGLFLYGSRRREALLGRFAASRLLQQLTTKASRSRNWIRSACIFLALAAIGIALARPQLGVEWSERKARGLDIVFILDGSKSMLATDLHPTRLARAKLAIIDLVERLESDRIGLVAFAGQAFLQTPLTLDYAAFRESLAAVDPNIMTRGGSDLGKAIAEAAKAFPSDNNVKTIVLLTDGEDLGGSAIAAAKDAQTENIQIFAIGIGTPEGEYLKVRNAQGKETFIRDLDGQPVHSQLDEATLQQIAQTTGGSYSRLSRESLDRLYNSVLTTLPRQEHKSELQEIHIERFQWALSLALFFLVMETLIRRRRKSSLQVGLMGLTLLTIAPTDLPAQDETPAQNEATLDARSRYNAAYQALLDGDYESAQKGYASALSHSDNRTLQRDALYNMGHAAYQQGRQIYENGDPQAALEKIKEAEELFKSAQEIDPADTSIQQDKEQIDAVRTAIEQLIEQQKKQQQEGQNQNQDQDQQQGQEGQQSNPSQDGQDSDQTDEASETQQDQKSESQQGQSSDSQDPQPSGDEAASSPADTAQENAADRSDASGQEQSPETSPEPDDTSQPEQSTAPNDTSAQNRSTTGQEQTSTQDPVDDIPDVQAEQPEPPTAEEQEQADEVPQPTESTPSNEDSSVGGHVGEAMPRGMTEAEATTLLDSLRGKETLLPFIGPSHGGQGREIRDW